MFDSPFGLADCESDHAEDDAAREFA